MAFTKKIIIIAASILMLGCFTGTHSFAKIGFITQIVSGKIVRVDDNIIELYADYEYHPGNKNWEVELDPGSYVTLRYYVDPNTKNRVYIEYAPGKNTLEDDNVRIVPKSRQDKK